MSEKREGYQFVGWYIDKECTKRLNPGGVLPHSGRYVCRLAVEW